MARVALTGGTGFLGSNVAEVLTGAGHDVLVLTRATPSMEVPWSYAVVDTSDTHAVQRALESVDALVHTAIANDFQNLDAGAAYNAYPGLSPLRGQDSGGGPMVDAKASVEFLRAVAAEATV